MSVAVGVASDDGGRIPLSRARVAEIVRAVVRRERVTDALLSVTFVGTAAMRRLNRRHLGRAGDTDVIAFGFRRATRTAPIVGDIYIAPDIARRSARANGVSVREELTRLIVHGTLHVLGYDHPDGDQRMRSPMWRRQEALVSSISKRRRK